MCYLLFPAKKFIDFGWLVLKTKAPMQHYCFIYTAAIFVMFPVYPIGKDSINSDIREKVPDYLSFQPRFGYIALNGRKTR